MVEALIFEQNQDILIRNWFTGGVPLFGTSTGSRYDVAGGSRSISWRWKVALLSVINDLYRQQILLKNLLRISRSKEIMTDTKATVIYTQQWKISKLAYTIYLKGLVNAVLAPQNIEMTESQSYFCQFTYFLLYLVAAYCRSIYDAMNNSTATSEGIIVQLE